MKATSVRREIFARDPQNRVAHLLRHPAVDAVTDNIVKAAVLGPKVGQALAAQIDVGESKGGDSLLALVDLPLRQVDAEKIGVGVTGRERNEIAPGRASEFKHAGAGEVGRRQLEDAGDRAEPRRMSLRKGMRDIRKIVIGSGVARNRGLHGRSEVSRHKQVSGAQRRFILHLARRICNVARFASRSSVENRLLTVFKRKSRSLTIFEEGKPRVRSRPT